MVMTHADARGQGQGQSVEKFRVETNGLTDERTEAIELSHLLN